jgi:hypothetical protein
MSKFDGLSDEDFEKEFERDFNRTKRVVAALYIVIAVAFLVFVGVVAALGIELALWVGRH